MGISRSTTILIAYLLSRDPSLNPKSALALIRSSRPFVEPNPGFMSQLALYHSMLCPTSLDDHPVYQRWLYSREVDTSRLRRQAPGSIFYRDKASGGGDVDDMIYQRWLQDEESGSNTADPRNTVSRTFHPLEARSSSSSTKSFRCRRCRTSLATSSYLLPHTSPPKTDSSFSSLMSPSINSCAHIFLEPLSWMRSELEQGKLDGRLECPNTNCGANVGKYAWQGMPCSCGKWVIPAISIAKGRVDEVG